MAHSNQKKVGNRHLNKNTTVRGRMERYLLCYYMTSYFYRLLSQQFASKSSQGTILPATVVLRISRWASPAPMVASPASCWYNNWILLNGYRIGAYLCIFFAHLACVIIPIVVVWFSPLILGILFWLVVSTPLKNSSQWEGLSHVLWKIKNVWNHQPVLVYIKTLPIFHM